MTDTAVKQGVLNYISEHLALVRWYRENACTKHGIPWREAPALTAVPDAPVSSEPMKGELTVKLDPPVTVVNNPPTTPSNMTVKLDPPITFTSPVTTVPAPTTPTVPGTVPTTPSVPTKPAEPTIWQKSWPWLLGAAIPVSALGGALAYNWWNQDTPSKPNVSPDTGLPYQSPLQWLEDEGKNRP